MSSQENINYKCGEVAGQGQMKKEQLVGQVSDACHSASHSLQGTKSQSGGGFLEGTGDLVMNMAQNAADALTRNLGTGNNRSKS